MLFMIELTKFNLDQNAVILVKTSQFQLPCRAMKKHLPLISKIRGRWPHYRQCHLRECKTHPSTAFVFVTFHWKPLRNTTMGHDQHDGLAIISKHKCGGLFEWGNELQRRCMWTRIFFQELVMFALSTLSLWISFRGPDNTRFEGTMLLFFFSNFNQHTCV